VPSVLFLSLDLRQAKGGIYQIGKVRAGDRGEDALQFVAAFLM
jgi:hypothetical protein